VEVPDPRWAGRKADQAELAKTARLHQYLPWFCRGKVVAIVMSSEAPQPGAKATDCRIRRNSAPRLFGIAGDEFAEGPSGSVNHAGTIRMSARQKVR